MEKLRLTPRLLKVAELVEGKTVADIGTDHGKLLIYLLQSGKISFGVGSDVAEGPASACRKNVAMNGLSDKIEIRVGDGLATIFESEVESIVIAGMGGELILKILKDNIDVALSAKELVVQPMTNIHRLLEGLGELGLVVCDAHLVTEKDKLYQIFKLKCGKVQNQRPIDFVICPEHVKRKSEHFIELIKRELKKYRAKREGILSGANADEKMISELDAIIKGLEEYETEYDY